MTIKEYKKHLGNKASVWASATITLAFGGLTTGLADQLGHIDVPAPVYTTVAILFVVAAVMSNIADHRWQHKPSKKS